MVLLPILINIDQPRVRISEVDVVHKKDQERASTFTSHDTKMLGPIQMEIRHDWTMTY